MLFFNVSNVVGADATKFATDLFMYDAWAVETGLLTSDVISAFPNPTIAFVIPLTVPVNVGPDIGANKFNADCVAVDSGLFKSAVLSAFPNLTIDFVIPLTVPVKVGPDRFANLIRLDADDVPPACNTSVHVKLFFTC